MRTMLTVNKEILTTNDIMNPDHGAEDAKISCEG